MTIDLRQIELSDAQKRQLAQLSERTGRPWGEILTEAIQGYCRLKDNGSGATVAESLFDALSRDGLIGCVPGGPADMSTNAQYMDGFGDHDRRTGSD